MLTIFEKNAGVFGVVVVVPSVVVVSSSDVRFSSDVASSSELNSLLYSGAMPSRIFWAIWKVEMSYFQSQSVKLSSSLIEAGHWFAIFCLKSEFS